MVTSLRKTLVLLLLFFLFAWLALSGGTRVRAGRLARHNRGHCHRCVRKRTWQTPTSTLVALRTNDIRTAKTEHNGSYTFVNLPIGTYSLTVDANGFGKKVYDAILVQASQATSVNTTLAVGSTNDTVRVSAESTPVAQHDLK